MARRLGMIGFASNSGLGTLSREFHDHLKPARTLLCPTKYSEFPERFPGARRGLSNQNIEWLLSGIDVLIAFETPDDWLIFAKAKKRGIKTILMPMYECTPKPLPEVPDLILCPSGLDYEVFEKEFSGGCRVEYLPVPVNRERIPFSPRRRARVFEHHAGHGGLIGRNGTTELLAAAPLLKSEAKIVIYTQRKIECADPNVEIRVGNFKEYWDIWGHGDVFVFPHRFDGLSLPIQEALSSGMPVLSTDMDPFRGWLPAEWMIPKEEEIRLKLYQRVIDVAILKPERIAETIDAWYDRDITADSEMADSLAASLDWRRLESAYVSLINSV